MFYQENTIIYYRHQLQHIYSIPQNERIIRLVQDREYSDWNTVNQK
jgi:hypothetical protein